MGLWTNDDFKVYIDLNLIESSFRGSCKSYSDAALTYHVTDSSASTFYNHTSKRYQVAADQIQQAGNEFDLRSLIVYFGPENEKENIGNSIIVERIVKQFVENGTALVYYKGEQVFVLKKRYVSTGEAILDHGYEIRTYMNDPEKYLFKDYLHLGW